MELVDMGLSLIILLFVQPSSPKNEIQWQGARMNRKYRQSVNGWCELVC